MLSGGGRHSCNYYDVISLKNLLSAWTEFRKGKRSKDDVAAFELQLEDNLFDLHHRLVSKVWKPDQYQAFFVYDPKLRQIHKATVRDRVLYQAVYRALYQIFDLGFIHHSYSSRERKGTHAGVSALEAYTRKVTKNHTYSGYALKCDIRKFFDSIDHDILFSLIKEKIDDPHLLLLIWKVIDSFSVSPGKGLPLGNVTSQLFANVYMNELDQYIKRTLKATCYVRYCDDFCITAESREYLENCVDDIQRFCKKQIALDLHPRKIIIRKIPHGVDFLGYVLLPYRRVIRPHTKARMFKNISHLKAAFNAGVVSQKSLEQSIQSYVGVLSHCKSQRIVGHIKSFIPQSSNASS